LGEFEGQVLIGPASAGKSPPFARLFSREHEFLLRSQRKVTRKHFHFASFADAVPSTRKFHSIREKDILKRSPPSYGELIVKREKSYANVIGHRFDDFSVPK